MSTGYQINDKAGSYFLTFQVVDWVDIFTRKVYRDIILDSFAYCRKHKALNYGSKIGCTVANGTYNDLESLIDIDFADIGWMNCFVFKLKIWKHKDVGAAYA